VSKFPGVALNIQRASDKGNEMPADDASIGNVELVNVLKTTD